MDNLATIEPSSTTLDPGEIATPASGGGAPSAEPASLRDSIEAAVKEVSEPEPKEEKVDEPAKGEDKAKVEEGKAKPEGKPEAKEEKPTDKARAPDGKFAGKVEEPKVDEPKEGDDLPKQAKQGLTQAPAKFLPDAKEKWANTPRPVQRDVENMIREREAESEQYREVTERYERVRQYDEVARQNGRDLGESLAQVVQFETMMQTSPVAALNMALQTAGPRKADGSAFSLFEVAQFIVEQGPEGYQRLMQQGRPQQQQREDPRIAQLQQELQRTKMEAVTNGVIAPFKAEHPRFDELEPYIASFLNSDMIPKTLSPSDRLAAAYDMAERINPASHVAPQADADLDRDRAGDTFSGTKSIKSAPGSVTPDEEPERGGSIREQLERSIRMQRRA
jgi:hypothetical protein